MNTNIKDLWIVGAGGFGREMSCWIKSHPDYEVKWRLKGFIDDPLVGVDLKDNPIKKYLEIYQLKAFKNLTQEEINHSFFILAIGAPSLKEKIVTEMKKRGAKFLNFVHPTAIMGDNNELGEGVIICPNVIITCDSILKDFVTVNIQSSIGHDCEIGNYTTISGNCDVTGNCKIGKYVHLGTHANLIPGTIVEDAAVVGAGTVGIKRVKANTTIMGVPGKKIIVPKTIDN